MLSLRNDLQELSFELAEILKEEIKKIKKESLEVIEYIKEQTKIKINRDKKNIAQKMIVEAESRLNQKEAKRLKQINRNVIKTKLNKVDKLINELLEDIKLRIDNNRDSYFDYIYSKFEEYTPLLNRPVKILFNKKDRVYLNEHPKGCTIEHVNCEMPEEEYIDTIGGFKIFAEDGSFTIDNTIEALIENNRYAIGQKVMEIFPVFEVDVESAVEIYEKKHLEEN